MRKKLKDMTPWERVEKRLQGLTNEEAEGIAFRILGQTTAKRVYVEGEDIGEIAKEYGKRHMEAVILGVRV